MGIVKIIVSIILSAVFGIFASAFYLINAGYLTISRRAEEIFSEEVTESEWNMYLGYDLSEDDEIFDNLKVSCREYYLSAYYFLGQPMEREEFDEREIVFDGDNKYYKRKSVLKDDNWEVNQVDESEIYLQQIQDGRQNVYYKYTRGEDGAWKKFKTLDDATFSAYLSLLSSLPGLDYYEYSFSEERQGYVYNTDAAGDGYVIKFLDGKLAGIWREKITFKNDTYSQSITDMVLTWGDQNVALPDVKEG